MSTESSLRLSEMSICGATSAAAAAWIFALGFLQRVRDTALSPIHSEKRDHRLQATSSERHYCGIFVGAARQTRNGRCRSRPGPRSSDSIGWFCCPAAVWRHAQTTAEVRPLSVWPGRYVGRPSHRHEGWGIPFIGRVEPQERSQDFAS